MPLLPIHVDVQPTRPYGASSEESVVVGDLLVQHVPVLASGDLEIVAIARRPTVLSKVAVRRSPAAKLPARSVPLVLGVGADHIRRVREALGGERIEVI